MIDSTDPRDSSHVKAIELIAKHRGWFGTDVETGIQVNVVTYGEKLAEVSVHGR